MKYLGTIVIWIVNLCLIVLLTARIIAIDNDKGPIVFIFGYLGIIVLNLIAWGILSLIKTRIAAHMGKSVAVLAILFVPLLIYLINY